MEGPPHETPQSRTLSELNAFVNRFTVARAERGLQGYGQRQSRTDQQAGKFGHLAIGETRYQPRHERSAGGTAGHWQHLLAENYRRPPLPFEARPIDSQDCSAEDLRWHTDRKRTRLNSRHLVISYAVFCLK